MGIVAVGFLLFMLVTSDPFDRLFPDPRRRARPQPAAAGPGHGDPPAAPLHGYVGFSVAFAFAIAALLGGRLDATWARWSRPWTTLAWMFLTLGIMVGSWWAYYELGWGGWWFWDPVENASFMPWLVGTALIHSLAVTEKRGTFKAWTVLLAIAAFSLSLLGTFLVRSGVLTSVHAFATDPRRGVFILLFLALVIGGSLLLFALACAQGRHRRALRAGVARVAAPREQRPARRGLRHGAARHALPAVPRRVESGQDLRWPPYFDAVFVPVMAPLVFLMGVGPLARWKKAELPDLFTRLKWAFVVSLIPRSACRSSAAGGRRWSRSACCLRCGSSRPPW